MRPAHWVRTLAFRPASTAAVIAMLSLGIAGVTAVRIVFTPLLFAPLPGVRMDASLVRVDFTMARAGGTLALTFDEFVRVRDAVAVFDSLAAQEGIGEKTVATEEGVSSTAAGVRVGVGYFETLGVKPRLGRLFTDDEVRRGADARVVVISEHLWRTLYQGDGQVIGQRLLVDSEPFTVVGVAAGFRGLFRLWPYDITLPLAPTPATSIHSLVGRLHPGVSAETAAAQISSVMGEFKSDRWLPTEQPVAVVYPGLTAASEKRFLDRLKAMHDVLMWGAVLLLVLATANATTLVMLRHDGRQVALAICHALGASRARLLTELLVGSAILAAISAAVGLGLGLALARLFDGVTLLPGVAAAERANVGWRTIGVALGAAGVALCAAGLLPAVAASKASVASLLRRADAVNTRRGISVRNLLLAGQIAVAFALVATTVVLTRTVLELRWAATGLNPERVAQVRVNVPPAADGTRLRQPYHDIAEAIRRTPGVTSAAQAAWALAPSGGGSIILPNNERLRATVNTVSEDYFRVLQIPLLAGRTFTPSDTLSNDGRGRDDIVVLSAALAERVAPFGNAVGRRVRLRDRVFIVDGRMTQIPVDVEVIGVVGHARLGNPRDDDVPAIYRPGLTDGWILARTAGPMEDTLDLLRASVRDVAPAARITSLGPFTDLLNQRIGEERLLARASTVVGSLAAVVACLGIGSVIAFALAQRRREVALRLALGASLPRAARDVSAGTLLACGVGGVAGLGLFTIASRLLEARVYGFSPLDPGTLAFATAVFAGLAAIAVWMPVRRMNQPALLRGLQRD